MLVQLAIFASGSGSNAQNIAEYFQHHPRIRVRLVLSNRLGAGVLERAARLGIETLVFDRNDFYEKDTVLHALQTAKIDWVILAGFLWLVPSYLLKAFPQRILNIHPALLPRYGGKGMYGHHVHEAVKAAGETESGITIHFANEHFDEGKIIFQARCALLPEDTPQTIAQKVQALEHAYFPKVIAETIESL
ncbi:MAG: phosphoribosylglycinamide formyltransferase [Microscillaceae bacterium]|nr:phosphoribosylglycinamide formyltransferase [Microscillaceae bacterium]